MHHRVETTETGWVLAKALVVFVVLGTLVGITVLSQLVSHASVGRIDCLDNQRATYQALLTYQADHDGGNPPSLDVFGRNPRDRSAFLGRCPADEKLKYYVDAASGRVFCPTPEHQKSP